MSEPATLTREESPGGRELPGPACTKPGSESAGETVRDIRPELGRAGGTSTVAPRHLAVVMDGNGRWARGRRLPRVEGHRAGAAAARECVQACTEAGVEYLTLFAFSSENWARPADEVEQLIALFGEVLERETAEMAANGVSLRFIGDRSAFPPELRATMGSVERRTAGNGALVVVVAANYGGHWDIVNAARRLARAVEEGRMSADAVDHPAFESELALAGVPSPDLLIRTGGEKRISNFLLWNLAYTELYFVETLWPEFDRAALSAAFREFGERERRFGRTSEQVAVASSDVAGAR